MIITIDGPVATGKSTLAKKLAQALGYIYYDTGAMYRAVTYDIITRNISLEDANALEDVFKDFDFRIKFNRGERFYFLRGEDITQKIRTEAVSNNASRISADPRVRAHLVKIQRELATGVNAVFEGRDMGTTVFPDADLKIFLCGRDEVRAKRRYDELIKKFPEDTDLKFEKVLDDLRKRDKFDMSREASPLRKADDAYEIDTSDLSVEEIIFKILECKDLNAKRKKKK